MYFLRLEDYDMKHLLRLSSFIAALGIFGLASGDVRAAETIGGADQVINLVEGTVELTTTKIEIRDEIYQDQLIKTGPDGATEISFLDETTITIGPDSELTLDKFVFNPEPGQGAVVVTLSTGVIRFFSGKLPKEAYLIKTPTATMGVRGTTFDLVVDQIGETTVAVSEGEVVLANLAGESIVIPAGLSSTVEPPGSQGTQNPPSALAPAPDVFQERVGQMDELFAGFFGSPNTAFSQFLRELDWSRILGWTATAIFLVPLITGGISVLSVAGSFAALAIVLWLLLG